MAIEETGEQPMDFSYLMKELATKAISLDKQEKSVTEKIKKEVRELVTQRESLETVSELYKHIKSLLAKKNLKPYELWKAKNRQGFGVSSLKFDKPVSNFERKSNEAIPFLKDFDKNFESKSAKNRFVDAVEGLVKVFEKDLGAVEKVQADIDSLQNKIGTYSMLFDITRIW